MTALSHNLRASFLRTLVIRKRKFQAWGLLLGFESCYAIKIEASSKKNLNSTLCTLNSSLNSWIFSQRKLKIKLKGDSENYFSKRSFSFAGKVFEQWFTLVWWIHKKYISMHNTDHESYWNRFHRMRFWDFTFRINFNCDKMSFSSSPQNTPMSKLLVVDKYLNMERHSPEVVLEKLVHHKVLCSSQRMGRYILLNLWGFKLGWFLPQLFGPQLFLMIRARLECCKFSRLAFILPHENLKWMLCRCSGPIKLNY